MSTAVSTPVHTYQIDKAHSEATFQVRHLAETFPTLAFKSASVTPHGGGHFDVAGTLTIRGTSQAITIPVTYLGTARDPWGRERAAFEAEVTLNRKDFGLNSIQAVAQ